VVSITGPEYILNMHHHDVAFLPYEELKQNVSLMMAKKLKQPFISTPKRTLKFY
jgi:hypothetical protein